MTDEIKLEAIGWSAAWATAFDALKAEGCVPARVSAEHRGAYEIMTAQGTRRAQVTGRLRYGAEGRMDMPAVGDWVAVTLNPGGETATIHAILPRKSAFVRKAAGARTEEQIAGANVDTVFLVSGLDRDFNLRRIERYLTLSYDSGANPVILLNKADLCENPAEAMAEVEAIAPGVPVLLLSAMRGDGVDNLLRLLKPGTTGAMLGSSGVGKSTLINALLGRELLKTREVRAHDDRGRHTTTHRQLIPLENGAALIDTPGMRELQLLGDEEGLARSFADIEALSVNCRFSDCSHTQEPGCAVRQAVETGAMDAARYESYLRQRKELRHLQTKQDVFLQQKEKQKWKAIMKSVEDLPKWRERK